MGWEANAYLVWLRHASHPQCQSNALVGACSEEICMMIVLVFYAYITNLHPCNGELVLPILP